MGKAKRAKGAARAALRPSDSDPLAGLTDEERRLRHLRSTEGMLSLEGFMQYINDILFDWAMFPILAVVIILFETFLTTAVIQTVPYTEIDWKAYMQEVEGYLGGELDYVKLRGDTGPLVYPAGFLYIYSWLRTLTNDGVDIKTGQWIFMAIYLSCVAVILAIYHRAKACPPWVAFLVCLSRRVHSIFVLRLFNDCIAIGLAYVAIYALMKHKWLLGCVVYSIAVSVKMNVFLFAPALAIILVRNTGFVRTLKYIGVCAAVQVVLGAPFLATHPVSYITKAFELSRVFFYKWTVNFRFLPEEVFVSKQLATLLLFCNVAMWLIFMARWMQQAPLAKGRLDGPQRIATWMFTSNFVGVVFARTLHYQFYCWYFMSLPLLLWRTRLPILVKLAVLVGVEYAFNVFPATPVSSLVLQGCHLTLLAGLCFFDKQEGPADAAEVDDDGKDKDA